MKAAYEMKDVEFPQCAGECAAMHYLGAGECESVCPWKFDSDSDPKEEICEYPENPS